MKDSLQTQLNATKRRHILDAAATVFAEKGFHAATIKDIATAAGVAQGSIYNYFENKDALLLGLFNLMTERTRAEQLPPPITTDPRALLRTAMHAPLVALTSSNAELFRVVVSEAFVNQAFAQEFRRQILEPMLLGAVDLLKLTIFHDTPAPPDLELRARVLSGLILGTIMQRVLHDDVLQAHWDELPALLADVLLHGMSGGSE